MKSFALFSVAASIGALGFAIFASPTPRLVWNGSQSVPLGLYYIGSDDFEKGDLVLAKLGEEAEMLAVDRGYLPPDVPVLKHVLGVSGDVICRFDSHIFVNGERVSEAKSLDQFGRSLPKWRACVTLKSAQVFLMNDHPSSYDGRYFGPTNVSHVAGYGLPPWTYESEVK